MRSFSPNKPVWWSLAALGLAARWIYILMTPEDIPHTDFQSFADAAVAMTHPYDTSFREPVFVWWLWLLGKIGVASHAAVRAATALWFLPAFFGAVHLGRRLTGPWGAAIVAALYAFLPAQIHADTIAMRHLLEACGVALFLRAALNETPPGKNMRPWAWLAGSAAFLALIRVNHIAAAGLFLAYLAGRRKSWRPLAALAPAAILLLPHFLNNQGKFGDPLHSVNYHSYWFTSLENIGKPGFPATFEERAVDPYRKTQGFWEWRFQGRPPMQVVLSVPKGLWRALTVFHKDVYFAFRIPMVLTWLFLALYGLGLLLWLKDPAARPAAAWILAFSLPYALVMHVFWAGRFFVPLTPVILPAVAAGWIVAWNGVRRLRAFRNGDPR